MPRYPKLQPTEPYDAGPILRAMGRTLRAARKAQGRQIEAISKRIGLSRSSINALERGEEVRHFPTVLHYAAVLGLPPQALFPPETTTALGRLLVKLNAMPPEWHAKLDALLEDIALLPVAPGAGMGTPVPTVASSS